MPDIEALTGADASDFREVVRLYSPPVVSGTIDLTTYPGITQGVQVQAVRQANYTALQAAFDAASSQSKWVEAGEGRFQYEGGRVMGAFNAGLQAPPGMRGLIAWRSSADAYAASFTQYLANHAAMTLGDPTAAATMEGNEYRGFRVGVGVTGSGQTKSVGLLLGQSWFCRYVGIHVDPWIAGGAKVHPYNGVFAPAGQFFFSNSIQDLKACTGINSLFAFECNGTGSVWSNTYVGGGNTSDRNVVTNAFRVKNTHQMVFQQLNVEWTSTNDLMTIENTAAVVINCLHLEGNKSTGADPHLLNNVGSSVTINAMQVFDHEFKGADLSGTPAFFAHWVQGSLTVDTMDVRFKNGGTGQTYGMADVAFRAFRHRTSSDNFGVRPQCDIKALRVNGHTGAFDIDASLPAATFGAVTRLAEYEADPKGRSRTRGAILIAPDANFTYYAAHEDMTLSVPAVTATRTITLSNMRAPSGPGATVPRKIGDRVMVHRTSAATGAFNLVIADHAAATIYTFTGSGSANTEKYLEWTGSAWVAL